MRFYKLILIISKFQEFICLKSNLIVEKMPLILVYYDQLVDYRIVNLIKKETSNGTLFQQQLPATVISSESSDEDISFVQKNKLILNDLN